MFLTHVDFNDPLLKYNPINNVQPLDAPPPTVETQFVAART
jgi:hypothetical protein